MIEQWKLFRKQRDNDLSQEFGWLTLTSLDWIDALARQFPNFPCSWRVEGDVVYAEFEPGQVERFAVPVEKVEVRLENEESDLSLRHGTKIAEVAKRAERYALRVRDNASDVFQEFRGVPTFEYDPDFVLSGTLRVTPARQLRRDTSQADVWSQTAVVATLELDGLEQVLEVEGDLGGNLQLIFHDRSNGVTTAPWRVVEFRSPFEDAPEAGSEHRVEIDFNYAINFPAAFTAYGTCPRPLSKNFIDMEVNAGERDPRV